jgi:hypothetical protein
MPPTTPVPPEVSPEFAPTGDPEFLSNPPVTTLVAPTPTPPIWVPAPEPVNSPLLPVPLFDIPSVGSGLPTLSTIFLGNSPIGPSVLARVFGDSADGSGFGASSLATVFTRESLPEFDSLKTFGKKSPAPVDRARADAAASEPAEQPVGAPTFARQIADLQAREQRQQQALARALAQFEQPAARA